MAKLPGALDVGPLASPDASRPIAVSDVGGIGRGGAALADAGRTLAAGLDKLGDGLGALALDKGRYEYSQASADRLTRKIELSTELEGDQDYQTMPQRYGERLDKINQDAAAQISVPGLRERFLNETQADTAQFNAKIHGHARKLWADASTAHVSQQGNQFIEKAVASPDDETRRQIVDTHAMQIDGLQAAGVYTPQQALAAKQDFAKRYYTAMYLSRADREPDVVINELRSKPGSSQAITGRILFNEGTAQNAKSSAVGAGQFINSTWLDVLKRNRPELAEGRTDQELLALRADRQLGREMTEAYRAENEAYLRGRGHPATPGQQYLAHFLGPTGADAVLKANPNMPVGEALAQAVGPAKARQMIEANPEVLGGKLSGSVAAWADRKMGGHDGGPGVHEFLAPEVREQILQRAYSAKHARTAEDLTQFKARVTDSSAEAFTNGQASNPVPREDFIRALGHEQGEAQYKAYQAQLTLGADVQRLADMDPAEQQRLYQSYTPEPGSAGYAEGLKRQDALGKAIGQVTKERDKDPAGFAIRRLPVVRDAYEAFSRVAGDPTAPFEQKQAAARTFATKADMEQARIGVPADQRRIVPAGYIDALVRNLEKPVSGDGKATPLDAARQLEAEARLWGDAWPAVSRDVQGKATIPIVRVLAAGVTDQAGMVLPSLINVPLEKILQGHGDEKPKEIKKEVATRMREFAATMLGTSEQISYFNDFLEANGKLAAHYVLNGKTAAEAAELAFQGTLGHKYEFVEGSLFGPWGSQYGVVRVPKDTGIPLAKVKSGAAIARQNLGEFDLAAAVSYDRALVFDSALADIGLGRRSPESMGAVDATGGSYGIAESRQQYLRDAAISAVRRDAVWTTAPGDVGLALVLNEKVVPKKDGAPLIFTWEQLAKLADQEKEKAEKNIRDFQIARGHRS